MKFRGNSYSEINNLAETLNTAAYELGNADARQKDLIANVSHDLKTPLTMIRSYAEMIRDLSGENPEKRNAHLQVIIDESERMSRLVSDMASISAMQTKKVVLHKQFFDLSELSASILASFDIYQEQQGYDFDLHRTKRMYGICGQGQNLTGNFKSCRQRRQITAAEDKYVGLTIRKAGRKYRLEVSDHGPA